jgi:hypothetical protein
MPQPDLSPADRAWKRLNARGDARIYQGNGGRPVVLFWPRGQTGNPFCQRNFAAATLEEALVRAEEETRPPSRSVDETRDYREWHEQMTAEVRARHAARSA